MPKQRESGWRNYGDHPIVVFVGILVAVVTLISFITGKTSLAQYFPASTVTTVPITIPLKPIISSETISTPVLVVAATRTPVPLLIGTATQIPTTIALRQLVVADNYDHFVSVRSQPISTSTEIKRLYQGDVVFCSEEVRGEEIEGANTWIYCPNQGGFIFLPLLIPRH